VKWVKEWDSTILALPLYAKSLPRGLRGLAAGSVFCVPYSSNCGLLRPVNKGMWAGQLFHPNEEVVWSTGS
jgi:hypothetical protein